MPIGPCRGTLTSWSAGASWDETTFADASEFAAFVAANTVVIPGVGNASWHWLLTMSTSGAWPAGEGAFVKVEAGSYYSSCYVLWDSVAEDYLSLTEGIGVNFAELTEPATGSGQCVTCGAGSFDVTVTVEVAWISSAHYPSKIFAGSWTLDATILAL